MRKLKNLNTNWIIIISQIIITIIIYIIYPKAILISLLLWIGICLIIKEKSKEEAIKEVTEELNSYRNTINNYNNIYSNIQEIIPEFDNHEFIISEMYCGDNKFFIKFKTYGDQYGTLIVYKDEVQPIVCTISEKDKEKLDKLREYLFN